MLAVASLKRSLEFDPVEQGVKRKRAEIKLSPTTFTASPSSSSSPSKQQQQQQQQQSVFTSSTQPSSSKSSSLLPSFISTDDAPIFTYDQTAQMCARFLREQEKSIREQYKELLTIKLNEQYEQFIRYSHDSVHKHSSKQKLFHFGQPQEPENSSMSDFSYVS